MASTSSACGLSDENACVEPPGFGAFATKERGRALTGVAPVSRSAQRRATTVCLLPPWRLCQPGRGETAMTNRTNSWSARSDWRARQRSLGSAFRAAFPELCVWPELRRSPPWLAAEEVLDLGALWLVIDKEKRVEVPHAFSQALHRTGEVVAVERLADAKTDRLQVEVAVAQHKHTAGGPSTPKRIMSLVFCVARCRRRVVCRMSRSSRRGHQRPGRLLLNRTPEIHGPPRSACGGPVARPKLAIAPHSSTSIRRRVASP